MRIAGALTLALGLQGCMTALYLADRPSQAVLEEMAQRCAIDAGVRWFGARPEGIDLWLPGQMSKDPADDPDLTSVRPYTNYAADVGFLSTGLARAIYVEIDATGSYYFGPGAGDPSGTYRFQLFEPGDPRCAEWIAYNAARAFPGTEPYHMPGGSCLAWDRVEAPPDAIRANAFIRFDDTQTKARGLYRDGEVLIVDGKERARSTSYWAINPDSGASERRGQWGIKACQPDAGDGLSITRNELFP